MAWEQCPWCPEKQNGYSRKEKHRQSAHPREYARLELTVRIELNAQSIAYHRTIIAKYEEYSRFLATVSDYPLVRDLVIHGLGRPGDIEHHREYLSYAEEDAPRRQAALEAFDLAQQELAVS